jgi:hypothetical protein
MVVFPAVMWVTTNTWPRKHVTLVIDTDFILFSIKTFNRYCTFVFVRSIRKGEKIKLKEKIIHKERRFSLRYFQVDYRRLLNKKH